MTARGQGKNQLAKLKDQQAAAAGEEKGVVAAEAGIKRARTAKPKRKLNFRASGVGARKSSATAKLRERAVFRYADGSFTVINSSKGRIDGLGLTPATDANAVVSINGSVRALSPGKGKTMGFSYGYTTGRGVTRNRTQSQGLGQKRKVRKANGGKRYFSTITIPSDANFDDVIAFANSWNNKPDIVRLGKQQISLSESKTKVVSYDSAFGFDL